MGESRFFKGYFLLRKILEMNFRRRKKRPPTRQKMKSFS